MDRECLKKKFPSYFPIDKLPKGAKEEDIGVYRICKYGKIEPNAFLTSYEEDKKFNSAIKEECDDIGYFAMSCFEKIADAKRMLKFFTKKEPLSMMSKGVTKFSCGMSQRTRERDKKKRSHVDWWLYDNSIPHVYFTEVKENEIP